MQGLVFIILKRHIQKIQTGKAKMKSIHSWCLILVVLSTFFFNACGGDNQVAGGGIGGSGIISSGAIASFGSIVVNGTTFNTSYASVIVNGEELGIGDTIVRSNLDVGKVVTVEGPGKVGENDAIASRIIYSNNIKGPLEHIDRLDRTTVELGVLGQPVTVNAITRVKGASLDTLRPGDVVEVSGFRDDTGAIQATFVGRAGTFNPDVTYEVSGFLKNLDTITQTFMINHLTVDYSLADTGQLPGGAPANGQYVEVEGTLVAAGGELVAIKIEPADRLEGESADQFEVMGIVIAVASISEFTLGNQWVVVEADAVIVDGELTDIAPGVKLEAEGTLVEGILYAHEIEFWLPDQVEVEGVVTQVVSDAQFTVGNQVVVTNDQTVFEGGEPEDIVVGINLEIKGRQRDGILVADKVSFEDEDSE
jgi:hypothetical protein